MEHAEMQGTDSTLPCHGARDLQRHGGTPHFQGKFQKALFLVGMARQSFYLEVPPSRPAKQIESFCCVHVSDHLPTLNLGGFPRLLAYTTAT